MAERSVQGCIYSVFWKALPTCFLTNVRNEVVRGLYKQKRHQPRTVVAFSAFELARKPQATSAICTRIFFMAFFSSWRIRSADTPYLSASSCNVDLLSDNQRSRRIS